MQIRNLIILVLCQLISATGSIVFVILGGILGASLSRQPALATLPVSLMIIATALATWPATMLMRRIGRGPGFSLSSASAALAVVLAAYSLVKMSFAMFLIAAFIFGINMAFTQQYRYAAAESVASRFVPRAISFVLLGSIGGALLGPELATRGANWLPGAAYAGTMLALAALYATQALLHLFLVRTARDDSVLPVATSRPLWSIVGQPVFLVAVLGGTAGYGLMSLIMTATPLSMHINDGHTVAETAQVIRAHVLSMYIPSLISGLMIEKLGVVRMMMLGAIALVVTTLIGLLGQSVLHYWWALIMLGVGWNFLYVGATSMLTYTYSPAERFHAQGVNEVLVFGTAATASLMAGTIMHYLGWRWLILIPLPVIFLFLIALLFVRDHALLNQHRASVVSPESG